MAINKNSCANTDFYTWHNPENYDDVARWCPVCYKWGYDMGDDHGFHLWGKSVDLDQMKSMFRSWNDDQITNAFTIVALY